MNPLKVLVALVVILCIASVNAKQLRAKKAEPASHMPQAVDEEWRKYVVPAGEQNQGKIFYYNTKTKEKSWDPPTTKKGNNQAPVKYLTVEGGFAS